MNIFNYYDKNKCLLGHKSIYIGMLFKHELKLIACHSYGSTILLSTYSYPCKNIIIMVPFFHYLTWGDNQIIKVFSWWLYHFIFLLGMAINSKIDWDNYCICLMIINAFSEMLCHIFCNKGRVHNQILVFLMLYD